MIDKVLALRGIGKSFNGVTVLDNINIRLESGTVYGLAGENGAGKSTLMKIINGAYIADEGEIFVDGKKVAITSPQDAQDIGIGMVYQELGLLPDLNVAENIFISHLSENRAGYIKWKDIHSKSEALLRELEIDIDTHTRLGDLKVAYQQLIAITRALSKTCKLLILDEPTSSLTDRDSKIVLKAVKRLKDLGYIIIYISHKLDEVLSITDKVIVLRNGKQIGNYEAKDLTEDELAELIAGRKLEKKFPKVRFTRGSGIMEVENLTVPGMLKDVSFKLYQGEILGIAGLMGAGKTEIAKTLFGIFGKGNPHYSGKIVLNGKDIRLRSPADAIENSIGLVPENRATEGLLTGMSIMDNTILASLGKVSKGGWINQKMVDSIIDDKKTELEIKCGSPRNPVSTLSGGNQQKVVLAKWLTAQSKVIIFDEPTKGIDVGAKVAFYELMNDLVKKGVGIIMMSSELDEVYNMSDRIIVMKEGSISYTTETSKITLEELKKYL